MASDAPLLRTTKHFLSDAPLLRTTKHFLGADA
jgi:hypothetical protein